MGREGRDYWEAQLSEYWDSGLTIQEYSELKELPYESVRRWIRVLQKARQDEASTPESLELVEIKPLQTNASDSSGIRLLIDGIEITVTKGFDGTTLSEVLNLLKARSCSASVSPQSPPCQKSGEQNFWSCFFAFECVRTDFSSLTGKR